MSNRCCYKSKKNIIKIITKTKINMSSPNFESSKVLDAKFKEQLPKSIEKQISNLENFRISDECRKYIESIREAVYSNEWILWKSELSEIKWCLSKTKLESIWLWQECTTRVHRLINLSANNTDFGPDESLVA